MILDGIYDCACLQFTMNLPVKIHKLLGKIKLKFDFWQFLNLATFEIAVTIFDEGLWNKNFFFQFLENIYSN